VIESPVDELKRIFPSADIPETIARIGLCQAQNSIRCGIVERLDLLLRPWKGDLYLSAERIDTVEGDLPKRQTYRSVKNVKTKRTMRHLAQEYSADNTDGALVHALVLRNDQRVNLQLSEIVDQAVLIGQSVNKAARDAFLLKQSVPLHVQLRVFSCAAFRRKS
jgi:hypothetical protein